MAKSGSPDAALTWTVTFITFVVTPMLATAMIYHGWIGAMWMLVGFFTGFLLRLLVLGVG